MRNIQVTFDAGAQIQINGKVYTVRRSAYEVRAVGIETTLAALQLQDGDVDGITAFLRTCVKRVDELLGDGAMAEIADGNPVSVTKCIQLINEISAACSEGYNEYAENEYLQPDE